MQATAIHDTATTSDTTSAANELTTMTQETGRELRDRLKLEPRTIQRAWLRLFGESFDVNRVCTFEEVAAIESEYLSEKEKNKRAKAVRKIEAGVSPGQKVVPVTTLTTGKKWLLWACLALSLGCSVPNMLSIMEAIKGSEFQAWVLTSAFTIAPFLLIGYGVRGVLHVVVYMVIGVEVFCNAAGFYGGMTGLSHSLYTTPTMFLHMVTSMTNSGNEGTALILSICMAVCIALLAVVPVYEIGKISRETGIKTDKK